MNYKTLIVEKAAPVVTVTLNRPAKLNAVNNQMLAELLRLFANLKKDTAVRFVLFTGAGRAFSSGADLSGEGDARPRDLSRQSTQGRLRQLVGHDMMRNLENLEQVTIALINGYALGAALSLIMACDFRIAAEEALLGIPETNVGIFYTWGSTPRLTRLVGPAKAKEMIMTCDNLTAQEAMAIGLVNKVVPKDKLMDAAHELVGKIASKGPLSIRITKKIVNAASAPTIGDIFVCEPELVERMYLSGEPAEGARAFRERRSPRFSGN